ncbi:hypothetical protein [Larkinella soli]|uniref:hypothetical protein n=1 Tax=Larkinella soli TaxID=1770527 RepID=UPI000FFCA60B|nr:hypothetical protein [Larkinella soli]
MLKLHYFLELLKKFDFVEVERVEKMVPTISKGNKKIDPKALFGVWKGKNVTLEQLRQAGWSRKPLAE